MDKYVNAIKGISDKINNSYILNPTKKTITIAFCALIALIAAVSGLFVIKEASKEDSTTSEISDTAESTITGLSEDVPMTANLLFALEGDENLDLLGVLRMDSQEKSVRVSFLDSDTYCSFNKLSGTMNEHYKQGGTTQLVWAVGEYASISIERFVIADYNTFKSVLNSIGDMTVNLEHDVICGQDAASLVIEEGQQTLVPEMMTKYFGYLCGNLEEYSDEIAKTMMNFGEKIFCNIEDEEAFYKSFERLISLFNTNVSAQDYVTYKAAIKSMANKEILQKIAVEENLGNLKSLS